MRDIEIPAAASLVRDFVNTFEPQTGHELFTDVEPLRDWLVERDLIPAGTELRSWDLPVALTLREGLRAVLRSHAGGPVEPAALEALSQALAEVPVRLTFTADGGHLVSAGNTALGLALAKLVDAIRQSSEDHSWTKLKACARNTCHWAFYDASRNQARRWCSMAGCGNHVKMQRAYAARKGRAQQASPAPEMPVTAR